MEVDHNGLVGMEEDSRDVLEEWNGVVKDKGHIAGVGDLVVGADGKVMCCTRDFGLGIEVWTVERDGVRIAVERCMVEGI